MRAQRLGGMRVQVEREYEGPEVGWDEGTSGESVWGTRGWGGMRVQVEGEYEGPEVGVG